MRSGDAPVSFVRARRGMDEFWLVPGVRAVEHTADLAIEVEAESLPQLFDRAALGMLALIELAEPDFTEEEASAIGSAAVQARPAAEQEQRSLELEAADLTALLVLWLSEILYLHQAGHLAYRGAQIEIFDGQRLRARIQVEPEAYHAVRELKGVTYHDLEVAGEASGWRARLVFDV